MTDPEDQVAADIAAAEARGEDPYADKPATADAPQVAAPEPEQVSQVTLPTPETAPVTQPVAEPEPEPVRAQPIYKTALPDDYKAQRTALVTQKSELMGKLMDGTIDSEAFSVEEARISDALDDLTAQRIRAETLQEANTQTQAAHQQREIQQLIARAKTDVDYLADPKAQRQFDTALGMVSQDPDNAQRSYADLIDEAHKVVLAMRGVVRTTAPGKAPEPRPERQAAQPPQTLSGLPTAASSYGKSVERTLAELSGDDLERAFDALPKGELARMLKS